MASHPALEGHFPGDPILPGVSILAAVLEAIEKGGRPIIRCSWRVAKFHSPARPGDVLAIGLEDRGAGVHAFTVDAAAQAGAAGARRVADGVVAVVADAAPVDMSTDTGATVPASAEGSPSERRV